ncbi:MULTISPECIES: DUF4429 domain-containing protein [Nocardiopsidaceae]|uniref:DUF4429 domain-containing protein n=2 Tax=Nocardiopsidaceae TaxID=83676 RepID=A0ABY6YM64_9ACTN|nr:DUF4429 domain-containing protein [Streptomonospora nanhaiensis]WAE73442.1 DUF4429 domain-containing protein [Streptomonospora nanhaiensis]
MAEVSARHGSWSFDGAALWITPGRRAHPLRRGLGVVSLPLPALAGVVFEPRRRGGTLRAHPRPGADPFTEATGGHLSRSGDPYQLRVGKEKALVAEYLAETVTEEIAALAPGDATDPDRYLVEAPAAPVRADAGDASVVFDGAHVYLRPNWKAESAKRAAGPQRLALEEIAEVRWTSVASGEDGSLRFVPFGRTESVLPRYDPFAVHWSLWGTDYEGGTTAVVATAVTALLPHPTARGKAVEGGRAFPALPWRRTRQEPEEA